jgi:hypothetical protein
MLSLNSVSFDTTGFILQEDGDAKRVWHTASGDGVGTFLFNLAPDIDLHSALHQTHLTRIVPTGLRRSALSRWL